MKRSLTASLDKKDAGQRFALLAGPAAFVDPAVELPVLLHYENARSAASLGGSGKGSAFVHGGYFAQVVDRKSKFITVDGNKFLELYRAAKDSLKQPSLKAVLVLAPLQQICKRNTTPYLANEHAVAIYRREEDGSPPSTSESAAAPAAKIARKGK